jgi:hypothetical protein
LRSTGTRSGRDVIRNQITFPAAPRIAHERGQGSEDTLGDARVRAFHLAVPERGIGFVDNDRDRSQRIEQAENAFEIGLGLSLPHRAEVEELDDRDPDLRGKAADHEALAGTYRAADQETHRDDVEPALLQRGGGLAQQRLRPVIARDGIEAGGAGQECQ